MILFGGPTQTKAKNNEPPAALEDTENTEENLKGDLSEPFSTGSLKWDIKKHKSKPIAAGARSYKFCEFTTPMSFWRRPESSRIVSELPFGIAHGGESVEPQPTLE